MENSQNKQEFQSFGQQPFGGLNNNSNNGGEKPNNYLALSIVGTVLGFCSCIGLITGIIAIVMSSQSTTKYNQGNYSGAVSSAKTAKILGLVSIGLFVLSIIRAYFNIQEMGGWEGMMEQMNEAIEAANNQ